MRELEPQTHCRLSGETLAGADVVLELPDCPIPGIYPVSAAESAGARTALRVVQARGSGFVQLAHRFDPALYADYGFAGNTSRAYRAHLEWFADELAAGTGPDDAILEVGCGDGTLLGLLADRGRPRLLGIDPGRAARETHNADVVCGYFPDDLPPDAPRRFTRIVLRHVLEHIEEPRPFLAALAAHLAPAGELWIEVPDLDATLARGLWSNFYQLHCNYFAAATLDRMAATAGLGCVGGTEVDVFGGSLLRRYRPGTPAADLPVPGVGAAGARFSAFRAALDRLAAELPDGAVGYGAAERTAMMLGASPALERRLTGLHDGNALLQGRHVAGTGLRIGTPAELYAAAPAAVVLFAVSHREEIVGELLRRLDPGTPFAVADGDCRLVTLASARPVTIALPR